MILAVLGPYQIFLILFIIGAIILNVFYLLNLQNTMKEVGAARQQVSPSNVWLMFIPLFNLIYPFILYPKISDSVKAEYSFRGMTPDGDFAKNIGVAMPILGLASLLPYIGTIAAIANIILLILFWGKMSSYKNRLKETPMVEGAFSFDSKSDLLDN